MPNDKNKKPKRVNISKSKWEGKGLPHPTTSEGFNVFMNKASADRDWETLLFCS